MDPSKDRTLDQLIERSGALIRRAEELKREQEQLLRLLEDLKKRTDTERDMN
jgi:hypothetical protein